MLDSLHGTIALQLRLEFMLGIPTIMAAVMLSPLVNSSTSKLRIGMMKMINLLASLLNSTLILFVTKTEVRN